MATLNPAAPTPVTVGGKTDGKEAVGFQAMNCPADDPSKPYTWLSFLTAAGETVYVPAWK